MSEASLNLKSLVLGSSHGRGIRHRPQNAVGDAYTVTSIFKPNADLSKDLTKEDKVVIVGGPGNSLDRNLNYQIEKNISDISQKTSRTNVK
jgi:hypothetical protein